MTEVEVYQPRATLAVPDARDTDSWITVCSDVIKVANVICDTPFVPDGLRGSAPAVAAAILAGRELGLAPLTSLANIHIIKGKPSLAAVLMRALIQSQGHQWQDGDVTDTRAVVRGRRKGESEWTEVQFTAEQAKRAGIDLGKYPQDKLYARATSRLARRKFADVIAGMPYSAEEMEDGAPDDVVLADDPGYRADREAARNGAAPAEAKPRTAQRKTRRAEADGRPTGSRGAPTAPAAASTAPTASKAASPSPDLPPLPGEDEPVPTSGARATSGTAPANGASDSESSAAGEGDHDSHGTVNRAQLTAIWTILGKVYGFTNDDGGKAQARAVCEHIIGRELAGESTSDMAYNEAKAVLDTLAAWRDVAEKRGEQPMDVLIAAMAPAQDSGAVDGGEVAGGE